MLSTDREEFVKRLRVLFAGLDKPLGEAKEDAFWKGLADISLIEFGRCCDFVLDELKDADKRREYGKRFTPGEIWDARRRLRSRINACIDSQTKATAWAGDGWDIRANQLLVGYIGDQARAGVHYCDEETRQGLRRACNPSEESRELIDSLVAYKHAWAGDMREAAGERGEAPPLEEQRRTFMECMRRASVDAEQIRAQYAERRMEYAA